jgi:peptidoglycan/LPS O-acetylase OafA/YrhL
MTPPRADAVRGHLPGLDGIRGLAILVVLVHNVGYFDEPADSLAIEILRVAFGAGWAGVQLFFVLSGLLITGILLDTKRDVHYFRSFYLRRILRIFPLYYLTLVGAFVVLPHLVDLGDWGAHARRIQIWYWTYLMNWTDPFLGTLSGLSHCWSLAVEEQFYLIWPFVVLTLSTDRLMRVCGVLVASALITRLVMVWWPAPVEAIYMFTITRWDALACGAAIAVAMRQPARYAHLLLLLRRTALPLATVLLLVVAVDHGLPWSSPLMQTVGYSIVAVLCSWLIVVAIDPALPFGWIRRTIAAPALRFFGKYSYGMYVLHWPIHRLGQVWLTGWVVAGPASARPVRLLVYVAANLIVSTAAAVAVFHLVERPFLAMKDRWARRG